MEGKCPGCGRAYDISEEFLAMGGKAKCPHCLLELAFTQEQPAAEPRRDPRRDLTKPDTEQRPRLSYESDLQPGPEEPDEVDAGCPSCGRRFKIDRHYLDMGGQARCPHCAEDLVVEGGAPGLAAPAIEDDLWSASGELDLPELDALRPQRRTAAEAGDAEPTLSTPTDEESPPGGAGEEVDLDFDEEIEDEDEAIGGGEPAADMEAGTEAFATEDPFTGREEEETREAGMADASFDNEMDEEVPTQLMDDVEGLDHLRQGDHEPPEDAHQATTDLDDLDALDEHTPTPGEPLSDSWDPFGESSRAAPVQQEFPAEAVESDEDWGAAEAAGGLADLPAEEEEKPVMGRLEQEPPLDEDGRLVMGQLEQELPPEEHDESSGEEQPEHGLDQQPGTEQEVAALPEDEPWEQQEAVDEDEAAGLGQEEEQQAFVPEPEDDTDRAGPEEENAPATTGIPDEGGMFAGLASTGDWAEAAARWAESGFKAEEMPSFIQGKPEEGPAAEEEGEPEQLEEETGGGEVLASEAAEQAVEVSDTDILMLDDDEVMPIEDQEPPPSGPAPAGDATWAERASQKIKEQSRDKQEQQPGSRLRSPAVLVGILGGVMVIVIGLIWIFSGGGVDPEEAVFPAGEVEASLVEAPAPAAYETKEEAMLHYGRGNQLAYRRKWEDAIAEYKKALRSDPGYPHPNRALGAAYAALGKAKLSNDYYQAYLRLAPESADAKQVKAIIETQNGR